MPRLRAERAVLDEFAQIRDVKPAGSPTEFTVYVMLTLGFAAGEGTIIAGRHGMGKAQFY